MAPTVARLQATNCPAPFHWKQIESTNYFQYIANLRQIGCPEATIRDIIRADLLALCRERSPNDATTCAERLLGDLLGAENGLTLAANSNKKEVTVESASINTTTNPSFSAGNSGNENPASSEASYPISAQSSKPAQSDGFISSESEFSSRVGTTTSSIASAQLNSIQEPPDATGDFFDDDQGFNAIEWGGDASVEIDLSEQSSATSLVIPSRRIKEVADRHALSEQAATAAWILLHLAHQDTASDEATKELKRLAQELVGTQALEELAAVR